MKRIPKDIEALAEKAKAAREKQCLEAVNKALDDHKCKMDVVIGFGDQGLLLSQVLKLPAQVIITSK